MSSSVVLSYYTRYGNRRRGYDFFPVRDCFSYFIFNSQYICFISLSISKHRRIYSYVIFLIPGMGGVFKTSNTYRTHATDGLCYCNSVLKLVSMLERYDCRARMCRRQEHGSCRGLAVASSQWRRNQVTTMT